MTRYAFAGAAAAALGLSTLTAVAGAGEVTLSDPRGDGRTWNLSVPSDFVTPDVDIEAVHASIRSTNDGAKRLVLSMLPVGDVPTDASELGAGDGGIGSLNWYIDNDADGAPDYVVSAGGFTTQRGSRSVSVRELSGGSYPYEWGDEVCTDTWRAFASGSFPDLGIVVELPTSCIGASAEIRFYVRYSWLWSAKSEDVDLAPDDGWSPPLTVDAAQPLPPGDNRVPAGGRLCFEVAGSPGDAAVVNLTPVQAGAKGNGLLVSSDVANPPEASNVNYGPGTVDPNVAIAPIGADGKVCYVNSELTAVHLVADHLGTIDADAYTPATTTGAPDRKVDTRTGLGGGRVAAGGRLCFEVAGSPGDAAVVNLTPVQAGAKGNGLLVSSDVANPPEASNVNYGPGTVDPNVAIAPIGADGKVCYVNSELTAVHLVADHLGTIDADAYTPATTTGAPDRKVDTRTGLGGGRVAAGGRLCFEVAGSPGDAAVVNLTPVQAGAKGNGLLVSSDVANPPEASNVNYGPGTVDPNVAIAPIGADGKVCYVNSELTAVHLVADHLGTIDADAYTPATTTGAPDRKVDTRTGLG